MRDALLSVEPRPDPAEDAPPLARLRRLHLEVTNRCNSVCETCVRTTDPDPDRDLGLAEIARIVELPGLESVALQVNGEPLLHRELEAIIALIHGRGVRVELNTNAIGLHEQRSRALIASGLDQLNISLDGATAETYRLLRGVDALAKVIHNAEGFVRVRGNEPRPELWAWMTASRHNIGELPALVELAARVEFDGLYLQRLVFYGKGLACDQDSLHGRLRSEDEDSIDRAVTRAAALGLRLSASGGHSVRGMLSAQTDPEPARACRRPSEGAVVMANGDVVPCCISTFVAPRETITMGNVLDSGWTEVWSGRPYARFRASLRRDVMPECCRQCGVRWSL